MNRGSLKTALDVLVRWLRDREPVLLVSLLLVVAGAWFFIELADEVVEGDTQAFDRWMVRAMRRDDDPSQPIGPAWMAEAGRDITALGGVAVLGLMVAAVAGFLALNRRFHAMWFVIAASVSGVLVSHGLKLLFARPRPDIVPHLSIVHTSSFPSAHSMMAAVVYLTLATLLATIVQSKRLKTYVLTVGLLLTWLVGVSRVYMGVHYPTDVLAGWSAGLAWAMGCWIIAHWLQRRGTLERGALD